MAKTATLRKVEEWDSIRKFTRKEWRLELSDGGRKVTRTRRAAMEWARELGYEVTS